MRTAKLLCGLAAVPLLALAGLAASAGSSLAAPTAVTLAASGITATSAQMNGTVNPMGGDTTVQFEFGTTMAYTNFVTAFPANPGTGMTPVTETAVVGGLLPDTTYHFQIQATSGGMTTVGGDLTFTTALATATPTPTVTVTPTVTPTVTTGTPTVLTCTAALIDFARAHDRTMTTAIALSEANVLASCQGLSTAQLQQAAANAILFLGNTVVTPTSTVTVPGNTVTVPVQVQVPVGAPGTGGGTGPETGIIAMAAAGGLALAGGSVLLASRLRRRP